MNPTYSTYEAKARFSEVLRLVREGTAVRPGIPVTRFRLIDRSA